MSDNDNSLILRNKFIVRICHWLLAICFLLVALSGTALFFPTLQWLTGTFGTPQMGRILHPFFGVVVFCLLMVLLFRLARSNILNRLDIPWFKGIIQVLKGNEDKVADVGKYNAGQKVLFWSIMGLISVLLVTGFVIWRPYFTHYFPIEVVRFCLLIHAVAAVILIISILVHIYMAIWVQGSIKGMVEGTVTRRWAKKHHPRWYREVVAKEQLEKASNSK